MLKNYFKIKVDTSISQFLKNLGEKKNTHYIVFEDGEYFVDIRTIALRLHNLDEKLNNLKKPFSKINSKKPLECVNQLINSSDRVIKINEGFFDFIDALNIIKEKYPDLLNIKLNSIKKKEIYALNLLDKISNAKNLFLKNRINILPVIDNKLEILGELRPVDLLISNLYSNDNTRDFKDSKEENLFNLPIENLMNKKPITISCDHSLNDLLQVMIEKKLPSIIITQNNKLYSIISYKDIFKLVKLNNSETKYSVTFAGIKELYEDDLDLIYDLVEKSMNKINTISDYDSLKVVFKLNSNTQGTHKKKVSLNLVLSKGNKIIHVDKEILGGTNDEVFNDKVKQRWNTPLMVQESLKILERNVIKEKNKSD